VPSFGAGTARATDDAIGDDDNGAGIAGTEVDGDTLASADAAEFEALAVGACAIESFVGAGSDSNARGASR